MRVFERQNDCVITFHLHKSLILGQRRLEEIHALRVCGLKNAIILVCVFWNICTVVWTDLSAFYCVLHVPSKGSEECTEACSCRLQQLNLSGTLSIRSRQGLASLQYLGGELPRFHKRNL